MRWTVHGERPLYESDWVNLMLVDIEIPGGERFDHHVIRMPHEASGTIVYDSDRGILLLWRHRFVTDTWGWEIPAGGIDPGESPVEAATRETIEETGWAPGPMRHLLTYHPSNGVSDQKFHLFLADGATHVGEPTDPGEAERVEWVALHEVRTAAERGEITDGLSLTALLYAFAFAAIG